MSNVPFIFSYLHKVPWGFLETDCGHLAGQRLGTLTLEDLNALAWLVLEPDPHGHPMYPRTEREDQLNPAFVKALQQEIFSRNAQVRVC